MKKVLLKVFILSLSLSAILFAETITFKELAHLASQDLNTTIYLDKDIKDYKVEFNIVDYQKRGEIYSFFSTVLFDHDMYLKYNSRLKYYTVELRTPARPMLPPSPLPASVDALHYYTYKIKNITNQDVVKTMSIFPKSRYVYLSQSDIISYSCTESQHDQIDRMLRSADNKSKEALIKITLFSVNKNKIKSFGSNVRALSFSVDSSFNKVFDNLLYSSSSAHAVLKNSMDFAFTLFALKGHDLVNVKQEPTIRVSNGKVAIVKSVLNVAYKESTVSIKENQQTTTDQIRYRDVGIQISVMPKIKDNFVHLDLNLTSEELISLTDNIPLTQKIYYKSSVTVKKGKPVLLTGIRKTSVSFEKNGIPILDSLPLFGYLFKKQSKEHKDSNINILIDVL